MRKLIGLGLIAVGMVLIGMWLVNRENDQYEIRKFKDEVYNYHKENSKAAAELSFELTRPYMTEQNFGRFSQRLEVLDRQYFHPMLVDTSDRYTEVIFDLTSCIDRFVGEKLIKECATRDRDGLLCGREKESVRTALSSTPRQFIAEMFPPLKRMGYQFTADISDLEQEKKAFRDNRELFEVAFKAASDLAKVKREKVKDEPIK